MKNKCKDCGKITKGFGQRCHSCAGKLTHILGIVNSKGKNNGRYIDGRTNKKYHCKICRKKICMQTAIYGKGICVNCNMVIKKPHLGFKHTKEAIEIMSLKASLRTKSKNNNWQGGISTEPYPFNWNKILKESIRKRDNYTCQLCRVPEKQLNKRLFIHHIDYDKDNILPDNLISLCNSCHSKTNGNRNYYYAYFIYVMENWK